MSPETQVLIKNLLRQIDEIEKQPYDPGTYDEGFKAGRISILTEIITFLKPVRDNPYGDYVRDHEDWRNEDNKRRSWWINRQLEMSKGLSKAMIMKKLKVTAEYAQGLIDMRGSHG